MFKNLLIAALFFVSILSANAQMSSDYVGKTSLENHKVSFKYQKFDAYNETIIICDTTYSIDWKALDITIEGDVFRITKAFTDIDKKESVIQFADRKSDRVLIIKYSDDFKRCVHYRLF